MKGAAAFLFTLAGPFTAFGVRCGLAQALALAGGEDLGEFVGEGKPEVVHQGRPAIQFSLLALHQAALLKIDIDDSVGRVFPGGVAIFFQWARASHFSSGFEVADGGGCLI